MFLRIKLITILISKPTTGKENRSNQYFAHVFFKTSIHSFYFLFLFFFFIPGICDSSASEGEKENMFSFLRVCTVCSSNTSRTNASEPQSPLLNSAGSKMFPSIFFTTAVQLALKKRFMMEMFRGKY